MVLDLDSKTQDEMLISLCEHIQGLMDLSVNIEDPGESWWEVDLWDASFVVF